MNSKDLQFQDLLQREGEAVWSLPVGEGVSPIKVIGNEPIVSGFGEGCFQQAINSRLAPGVHDVVLNPDAHLGYGAPVGCVMSSKTHIYPGPVGVDIKCSMSLLQTNVDHEAIQDLRTRRELIKAICQRIPTGAGRGQREAPKSRHVDERLGRKLVVEGASKHVLKKLGIPPDWANRCEDAYHVGPDQDEESLADRMQFFEQRGKLKRFAIHAKQLGSYGGGNHFGECEEVSLSAAPELRNIAEHFGLRERKIAFLSHCGSRGFGHTLASHQFSNLKSRFRKTKTPFPGNDSDLVYAEIGSQEANDYLCDMALGANFATVNHLLINQLVLEAFQQVLPGTKGELVYFISHNIARRERDHAGHLQWVHRKGATRAFPAQHPELAGTHFEETGHPILLPGNPRDGSVVMVADQAAKLTQFSVNHGAGRSLSRRAAKKKLNQSHVDQDLSEHDILSNCSRYPLDEAPEAYKDFEEVLQSVKLAGLAREVARLKAKFVIKDGSDPDD